MPAESTPTSSDGPEEQLADLYWTGLFMGRASENFKRFSRSNRADVDGLFADPPPLSGVTDAGQVVYWWPAIEADSCVSPHALSFLEALVLSPLMDFTYENRGIASKPLPRDLAKFISQWLSAYLWFDASDRIRFPDIGDLPDSAEIKLEERRFECIDLLAALECLEKKLSDKSLAEDVIRLFVTPTIDWCKSVTKHAHWVADQKGLSTLKERVESRRPLFINDPNWERFKEFVRTRPKTHGGGRRSVADDREIHEKLDTILARVSVSESATRKPTDPPDLLVGWHDILVAMGLEPTSSNRRMLKKMLGCPVIVGSRGERPRVRRTDLLAWKVELLSQHAAQKKKTQDALSTASETHAYGRTGKVAPRIGGSVRSRRKMTPRQIKET